MQHKLLEILRCPVTRSKLTIRIIRDTTRSYGKMTITTVEEGILFSANDWFFPIIKGIPRLCVEAFLDYPDFLRANMNNYDSLKKNILSQNGELLEYVLQKK